MKKKNIGGIIALIIVICISTLIFLYISKYFKMQDSLNCFGVFYSQDELAILKDNINPMQKTIRSGNYKVSLKGVWGQEKCTYFIFKIYSLDGSVINEKNIKFVIDNTETINEESGNLTLVRQEYKEDTGGNGILGIKQLSENDCEEFNIKIVIEKEQFLFEIPKIRKEEMKHFIPDENSNYLYKDIYLSPMSVYIITDDENINISDAKINISYLDGTNLTMEVSDGFVSKDDKSGKVKIHLQFLNELYDITKIETIAVGNMKYKNNER